MPPSSEGLSYDEDGDSVDDDDSDDGDDVEDNDDDDGDDTKVMMMITIRIKMHGNAHV
jgi:hypothetical protein